MKGVQEVIDMCTEMGRISDTSLSPSAFCMFLIYNPETYVPLLLLLLLFVCLLLLFVCLFFLSLIAVFFSFLPQDGLSPHECLKFDVDGVDDACRKTQFLFYECKRSLVCDHNPHKVLNIYYGVIRVRVVSRKSF